MKERVNLVEQAQQKILDYISNHPDEKQLPKEQDFIGILNVSRGVLREALSQLRALGLIETKRKKGTVLVNPDIFAILKPVINSQLLDKKAVKYLYQLRLMLEIGAADFIFAGKNDKQMAALEAIVSEEVRLENEMIAAKDDEEKMAIANQRSSIDVQFHSTLFEMTGNKYLVDFQFIIRHLFTLYSPSIKKDFKQRTAISHVGLYNILRTGTPDAFRMAMRLHLSPLFEKMDEIIEDSISRSCP